MMAYIGNGNQGNYVSSGNQKKHNKDHVMTKIPEIRTKQQIKVNEQLGLNLKLGEWTACIGKVSVLCFFF